MAIYICIACADRLSANVGSPQKALGSGERSRKTSGKNSLVPDMTHLSRGASDGLAIIHSTHALSGRPHMKRNRSWDAAAGCRASSRPLQEKVKRPCSIAHVPYNRSR